MSETNYEDILNTLWDAIPEPEVLPGGSWLLRAKGAKYFPAGEDTSARVMFIYGAKEPMQDVDESALKALEAKNYDVSSNRIFFTVWIEDGASWQTVRNHLKKHGIDLAGKSPQQSLKEVRGKEVVAFLDTRTYQNKAGDNVTENTATNFVQPE